MTKKQELVAILLGNLEKAAVEVNDIPLYRKDADLNSLYEDNSWEEIFESYPEELLERLVVQGIAKGTPIDKVIKSWQHMGLYKFPVELWIDEYKIPMLRLRYNRFLSWFRGYRFQVSGSVEGNGSYGESSQFPRIINYEKEESSFRRWVLLLGLCCEAAGNYLEFKKTMQDNPSLIEEFLAETDKACFRLKEPNRYKISSLVKCEQETSDGLMQDATWHFVDSIYTGKSADVFASIKITGRIIELMTYKKDGNKRYSIEVPDFEDWLRVPEALYYGSLILFNYADLINNFMYIYPSARKEFSYKSADDKRVDGMVQFCEVLGM